MNRAATFAKNLFFPKRCPYCGAVQGFAPVCDCADALERIRLIGWIARADAGGRGLKYLKGIIGCYRYRNPIRRGIHRMKFSGAKGAAEFFGEEMAQQVARVLPGIRFDAVIPVPSTRREIRERGYDVPLLMARRIAASLEIPLWDDILKKSRETRRQHTLSLEERRENLKGAFAVQNPDRLRRSRVLLCDDISTSGSTLEECAKPLKRAGAAEVWGIVLACTPRG